MWIGVGVSVARVRKGGVEIWSEWVAELSQARLQRVEALWEDRWGWSGDGGGGGCGGRRGQRLAARVCLAV